MKKYLFSYNEYGKIIYEIKKYLPILDFASVTRCTPSFCIIRHDVEFSVDRAYQLAEFEKQLGIKSNYFFQLRSNFYNVCERDNMKKVRDIIDWGHTIGVHTFVGHLSGDTEIKQLIKKDIQLLKSIFGVKINQFSFHRPQDDLLKKNIQLRNLINAYSDQYFPIHHIPYRKNFYYQDSSSVIYLSDSNHEWEFGYPLNILKRGVKRIQILFHPDYWTKTKLKNRQDNLDWILTNILGQLQNKLYLSMKEEDKTYQ